MVGFDNTTLTIDQLTQIANISSPSEFFINVNHDIYDGYLYFILLFALWIILYMVAQGVIDQPLTNMMYSGAVISIISVLMRGIYVYHMGVARGLVTDYQMWIFPIITAVIAFILWATKE